MQAAVQMRRAGTCVWSAVQQLHGRGCVEPHLQGGSGQYGNVADTFTCKPTPTSSPPLRRRRAAAGQNRGIAPTQDASSQCIL